MIPFTVIYNLSESKSSFFSLFYGREPAIFSKKYKKTLFTVRMTE